MDNIMFHSPVVNRDFLVCCKGCHENIPAPVETVPSQPVAAKCPLCDEHRQYLPSEVRACGLYFRYPKLNALQCLGCRTKKRPLRRCDGFEHIIVGLAVTGQPFSEAHLRRN